MTTPRASVVIVSWNTRELTRRCVESVRTCSDGRDAEIIVVDNESADGTADMIRAGSPDVILIANDENRYYAEANNQGAAAATGDFLCLLNSDAELRDGALSTMIGFLEDNPDYAVVGPQLLNPDGTVQQSWNRFYGLRDTLYGRTMLGRFPPGSAYLRRSRLADFDGRTSRDVEQLMGACLVVRRRDFLDIGGFDPAFSLYFNDHDLCRRFLAQGRRTRFLAEAHVPHLRGESTRKFDALNVIWNRNTLAYHRKYSGRLGLFAARLLLRAKAALVYFKIVAGPRSLGEKRRALRAARANLRQVLSTEG